MSDDPHLMCRETRKAAEARFLDQLDKERQRHDADAQAGAMLRQKLRNVRWKILRRAEVEEWFRGDVDYA